jgi:hypothetical protein
MTWPHERSLDEMNAFYGDPRGSNGNVNPAWYSRNIVALRPPYEMQFSWGGKCDHLLVHSKCRDAFAEALNEIKAIYKTQAEIERHRMHLTGGAFCFRLMRGSSSKLSIHSWGAALDMDPVHNPFPAKWRPGMIPLEAAACFQKCGLVWRGANGDDDCMHFQASIR